MSGHLRQFFSMMLLVIGVVGCTSAPQLQPVRQSKLCTPDGKVDHADWLHLRPVDGHLKVVAIGSSSTYGEGASDPSHSYPSQLQALLDAAPTTTAGTVRYEVLNEGISGQPLSQLIDRWDQDVYAKQPQLLVLQTGTADSIRGGSLTAFSAALNDIVAQTLARGIPVLLLDSQHYPAEPGSYAGFQKAMADVALSQHLALVDRYRFTTDWVKDGTYGYKELLAADNLHPNDFLHRCTAQVIAGVIEEAVQ